MISESLYNKCLHFVKGNLNKMGLYNIEALDVVHDAITQKCFSENNYTQVLMSIMRQQQYFNKIKPISESEDYSKDYKYGECKICKQILPFDYFEYGFNKNINKKNCRKYCHTCYNDIIRKSLNYKKTSYRSYKKWLQRNLNYHRNYRNVHDDLTAKERQIRFVAKQKEELGDWYIKRLLTRHKKVEVTPEMIEEKRQQVLKMRQEGNWRTKKQNK